MNTKRPRQRAAERDREVEFRPEHYDPDNWLEIPEFGVMPADVGFKGFALPIVHFGDADTAIALELHRMLKAARAKARKTFSTYRGAHELAAAAMLRILDAPADASASQLFEVSREEEDAMCFRRIERSLRTAADGRSPAATIRALAVAGAELAEWLSDDRRAMRERARAAAVASHAEHRALKEEARAWFAKNGSELTVDAAAAEVMRQVPMKLSTAKTWVREFRKERKTSD